MRLSIRVKQIAGVTAIVGVVVVILSGMHVTRLARIGLHESEARGELLANAIFHRVRQIVTDSGDPYQAIQTDPARTLDRPTLDALVNAKLIEFDKTEKIFTTPSDKRTEDYITGRFG